MKFYSGINILEFEAPSQFPGVSPLEKVQAIDRSADGALHVENFKTAIRGRTLNFSDMSLVDYLGLLNWFDSVANGAANQFYFEDEKGDSHLVRITSSVYNFKETSFELYVGSIDLEFS